jgi:hypothetical protein
MAMVFEMAFGWRLLDSMVPRFFVLLLGVGFMNKLLLYRSCPILVRRLPTTTLAYFF